MRNRSFESFKLPIYRRRKREREREPGAGKPSSVFGCSLGRIALAENSLGKYQLDLDTGAIQSKCVRTSVDKIEISIEIGWRKHINFIWNYTELDIYFSFRLHFFHNIIFMYFKEPKKLQVQPANYKNIVYTFNINRHRLNPYTTQNFVEPLLTFHLLRGHIIIDTSTPPSTRREEK